MLLKSCKNICMCMRAKTHKEMSKKIKVNLTANKKMIVTNINENVKRNSSFTKKNMHKHDIYTHTKLTKINPQNHFQKCSNTRSHPHTHPHPHTYLEGSGKV